MDIKDSILYVRHVDLLTIPKECKWMQSIKEGNVLFNDELNTF